MNPRNDKTRVHFDASGWLGTLEVRDPRQRTCYKDGPTKLAPIHEQRRRRRRRRSPGLSSLMRLSRVVSPNHKPNPFPTLSTLQTRRISSNRGQKQPLSSKMKVTPRGARAFEYRVAELETKARRRLPPSVAANCAMRPLSPSPSPSSSP